MTTDVRERSLARADWLDSLAQTLRSQAEDAQARELSAAAADIRSAVECAAAGCDGDLHFTGHRDPVTNEDIEAGPCPRWTAQP